MNGAELELLADVRGCADCQKEESNAFIIRADLERYIMQPTVAFVSPAVAMHLPKVVTPPTLVWLKAVLKH